MSKKTLRIITIVATILAIIAMNVLVFAEANEGPAGVTAKPTTAFNEIGGKIIGAIQAVGNIISIAMLVVLGIKYMMGSAEEKAADKKSMIPYVIGAVLIFAASNIAQMIYTFATSMTAGK